MDGAGRTSEGAEESDALVELLDLIQPWNSQVDPAEIWDHVMNHDSKLSWLEPSTLEKALEAAHAGEWRLCAYLAARCFKDWKERLGSREAAVKMGQVDQRCHRTLWLAVADVVLVDIPPGQERLRVLLDHESEPRWIATDQLESDIVPGNGRVVVRMGKGTPVVGQLVQKEFQCLSCSWTSPPSAMRCGHCGHKREDHSRHGWAERFNPGETIELSQLLWQKRLRSAPSVSPKRALDVESRRSTWSAPWSATNELSRSSGRSSSSGPKKSIRCLHLSEEERLRLHQLLVDNCLEQAQDDREDSFGTTLISHVSGTWYHVLAYPLFGDVTKALVRPAARCWAPSQKEKATSFTQRRGETLLAECAKACQWSLVEVLLRHGVPLPDLHREFEKVCGNSEATRRLCRKDWLHAIGPSGPTPLLELAAAEDAAILGKLLNALESRIKGPGVECCQLPDLVGGPGGKPEALILRAAEVRRWGVVAVLLSSRLPVAAGQFLSSPAAVYCPKGLVLQAEAKELKERFTTAVSRLSADAKTTAAGQLAEYFHRRHISTVLDASSADGFESKGLWLCHEDIEVWNELHQLGCETGAEAVVVFLLLSSNECSLLTSAPSAVKTLNLQGKDAALAPSKAGGWLPIFCPRNFLKAADASETGKTFEPFQCLPTCRPVASRHVRFQVQTCCCGASLEDFEFCLGTSCVHESKGTETGKDVEVRLGHHRLSAPSLGIASRMIDVTPVKEESAVAEGDGDSDVDSEEKAWRKDGGLIEVLISPGFLFFYVIQVEATDYLMLTGKLQNIPEEAQDFVGKVFFEEAVVHIRSRFEPFVLPALEASNGDEARTGCQDVLRNMVITNSDGQPVDLSHAAVEYLEREEDPCKVNLLRSAAPLRLGPLPKTLQRRRPGRRKEKIDRRRSGGSTSGSAGGGRSKASTTPGASGGGSGRRGYSPWTTW